MVLEASGSQILLANTSAKIPKNQVLGAYEIHIAREGFASIRHKPSGEIMHSRTPPMEEARKLYLEQSRLALKLCAEDFQTEIPLAPLVLWDVGLGAAANAISAIRCYEQIEGSPRDLHVVSFENNLDSLRLALRNHHLFPELRHGGPQAILEHGFWQSKSHPGLRWTLVFGDFPETLDRTLTPPDLIFYDMYSGQTHAAAWTYGTFRRLFAHCQGRPVELITYTCSTASRAAMLAAGFSVAHGRNAGEKSETTIALTPEAVRPHHQLLGSPWLAKWCRSSARFPSDLPVSEHPAWEAHILAHTQWGQSLSLLR